MIAAIRIRGTVHVREEIETTLKLLRLTRANHLVLLPEREDIIKMLKKVKDYITWGEISKETLGRLLEKRARLPGNKKLTLEYLKKHSIKSFSELAEKVQAEPKILERLNIKPVFRMRPPSKGYGKGGIKKSFVVGGALGYRGEKINDLIERML